MWTNLFVQRYSRFGQCGRFSLKRSVTGNMVADAMLFSSSVTHCESVSSSAPPELSPKGSELALGCWTSAHVSPEARHSPCRLIFGYGSLMWKFDYPYERKFACRILPEIRSQESGGNSISGNSNVQGFVFKRRLWMQSCDHRGTVNFPGRVPTLVKVPSDSVDGLGASAQILSDGAGAGLDNEDVAGMAYEITEADAERVWAELDYRERHGYTRTLAKVISFEGAVEETQVYYFDRGDQVVGSEGSAIVWDEPTEATAAVVAKAVGPSGSNVEYLRKMCACVEEIMAGTGATDEYLEELRERTEAIVRSS